MKRLKLIYTLTIVLCTVFFSGIIAALSIYTTKNILRERATEILALQCVNTCHEFDASILNVEQAVNTISSAAIYDIDDFERFRTDASYVEEYTEGLRGVLLDTAQDIPGTMSIYIRYNPELTGPTSGLYFVLDKTTGTFQDAPLTNLYDSGIEDMSWYNLPVQKGAPVWLPPYHNYLIGYDMISYIVPYYIKGELVGIIGMDMDYEYIHKLISDIHVYDTGYAFLLTPEGRAVVHRDYQPMELIKNAPVFQSAAEELLNARIIRDYEYTSEDSTISYTLTNNRLLLGIAAPNKEIYRDSVILTHKLILTVVINFVIVTLLTVLIINKTFRISEIDELTGSMNRKGFIRIYSGFDKEKLANYSLFLLDIDRFKQVNDTFGHNCGDAALKELAKTAHTILGKNTVFARWGGDEFIGLIRTEEAVELLEELRARIEEKEHAVYGKFTISVGLTNIPEGRLLSEVTEAVDKALYRSKTEGRNRVTAVTMTTATDSATAVATDVD